jgi:hypothetical protein
MSASAITLRDWNTRLPADEGGEPDCISCRDFRNALADLNARLAKAHVLLRAIRITEPKPDKPTGMDDDGIELLVIAHAAALAKIKTRIDLYLATTGARL